jgi:hypothetical protein
MIKAGFCPKRSASRLDQNEPMAIGDETAGAVCDEPEMVQGGGYPSCNISAVGLSIFPKSLVK